MQIPQYQDELGIFQMHIFASFSSYVLSLICFLIHLCLSVGMQVFSNVLIPTEAGIPLNMHVQMWFSGFFLS